MKIALPTRLLLQEYTLGLASFISAFNDQPAADAAKLAKHDRVLYRRQLIIKRIIRLRLLISSGSKLRCDFRKSRFFMPFLLFS